LATSITQNKYPFVPTLGAPGAAAPPETARSRFVAGRVSLNLRACQESRTSISVFDID